MDAAFSLAEYCVQTRYVALSTEVVDATKKEILDLLGVAVGGSGEPGVRELLEITADWGGKAESSVIGFGRKLPAPNAAHLNTTMAHALDFDDVHEYAVLHPGVAIIPVCLAVGEKRGRLSGEAFITAAALGVDMMSRMALAAVPGGSAIKTGWHLTSILGFIGAAATAGRILGLDRDRLVNAMGIAYHQCGGNSQCVKDGALTKRLGPGFAVRAGIVSALMAEKGVTGAHNVLEGEAGLYQLYFKGDYDAGILTAGLGQNFEGVNVAFKPYPCCRGIHPAIDAALAIARDHEVAPDDVEEIVLSVSEPHHYLLCTPWEAKTAPRNPVDAQFSIPWGVATALTRKRVGLESFLESALKDQTILGITSKMRVETDSGLEREKNVDPTRIRIKSRQGEVFERQVEEPLGSIANPMTYDDCAGKFRNCAGGKLPDRNIEAVIDLIGRLEKLEDIEELVRQLCPALDGH